jgi:hypothetical protein
VIGVGQSAKQAKLMANDGCLEFNIAEAVFFDYRNVNAVNEAQFDG